MISTNALERSATAWRIAYDLSHPIMRSNELTKTQARNLRYIIGVARRNAKRATIDAKIAAKRAKVAVTHTTRIRWDIEVISRRVERLIKEGEQA